MNNAWSLLGISKTSTLDEIVKAYRKLAMKHHPDREGGDVETFKKIKAAYEWLLDHYDEDEEIEQVVYKSSFSDGTSKKQEAPKQTWKSWRTSLDNEQVNKWEEYENSEPLFKNKPKPEKKEQSKNTNYSSSEKSIFLTLSQLVTGGTFAINVEGYSPDKIVIPPNTSPNSIVATTLLYNPKYAASRYENVGIKVLLFKSDIFSYDGNKIDCDLEVSYEDVINRRSVYLPFGQTNQIRVYLPDEIYSNKPIIIKNFAFNKPLHVHLNFKVPKI